MFDRLKSTQDEILSKGGNFVAFEYWGAWTARLGGVFDSAELRQISNVLKSPTSKRVLGSAEQPGLFRKE